MKINCTFELPEDFQQVCDIFGYQPEQVLQRFMEEVSFPEFFSDPDNDHRWATLFFLHNMDAGNGELADQLEQHQPYIDRMANMVIKDQKKAEKACRKIMGQWHKHILAKRAEYLLNKLDDDE